MKITDKQRLDWLEHGKIGRSHPDLEWWAQLDHKPWSEGRGKTARQARDRRAAILAEGETK